MKKKVGLLFSILLLYSYSYSQHIVVNYNIETNSSFENIEDLEGVDREKAKEIIEEFNNSFELINTMKSHLIASKSESYYWIENTMPSDVNINSYNMAKIMLGYDDKYYSNHSSGNTTRYFTAYDKKFKIETPIDSLNWKLSKETKIIGDLNCFKAFTSYKIVNKVGEHTVKVIAWYAPELQYNFGPKGFGGLPGLIVELIDGKITYRADTIIFKEDKLEAIKKPKGKLITKEELEEYGEKVEQNFINNQN